MHMQNDTQNDSQDEVVYITSQDDIVISTYAVLIIFIRIILPTLHTCFFALFGHNSVILYLLFCVILFKRKVVGC